MLSWLRHKATPVPELPPAEDEHHRHSSEERLERLLGRLGDSPAGRAVVGQALHRSGVLSGNAVSPGETVSPPADRRRYVEGVRAEDYEEALPLFRQAMSAAGGRPEDDNITLATKITAALRDRHGFTPELLTDISPYLVQFIRDAKSGLVRFEPPAEPLAEPPAEAGSQPPASPPTDSEAHTESVAEAAPVQAEEEALPAETVVEAPVAVEPADAATADAESAAVDELLQETAAPASDIALDASAAAVSEAALEIAPEPETETAPDDEEVAAASLQEVARQAKSTLRTRRNTAADAVPATATPAGEDRVAAAAGGASRMFVIAVCSQKGGAGKTTLAAHLAVRAGAAGHGPAVLIDTDPQGSLGEWWSARRNDSPALATVKLDELTANLAELRRYGAAIAIIDTPPALTSSIEQVIAVADLVLIPARPSPHDLRAVGATVEMARKAGKPFLFVVNGAAPRASITAQAVAALSEHGRVVPVILYQRTDYAASMIDGRTVTETAASGRSAQEINDLWQYVYEQIGMRVAA